MARSLEVGDLGAEELFDLMGMILDNLSASDLGRVREIVEAKQREKLEAEKNAILAEMRGKLEGIGLTLDDVIPARQGRRDRKRSRRAESQVLPVKYRSPEGDTWSGRGHVPKWLQQLEAEGYSRAEYAVDSGDR
jgi:DNA-binding protein H-NS